MTITQTNKQLVHGNHSHRYWGWYLFVTILMLTVLPRLPAPYSDPQLLVGAVGGLWAFAFYMQSRHAEDARFLKDLLQTFSEKYDDINNGLQTAVRHNEPFTETERNLFIDYFNMCAEEWLFRQMG